MCCFADEDVLNSVHRYRPKFLSTSDGLPLYYEPYDFQHTCVLSCPQSPIDVLAINEEENLELSEMRKCISVPFVPSSYFHSYGVAEMLATIVKEVIQFLCFVLYRYSCCH